MSEQEIPNQKAFVPHVLAALHELGRGVELDIQQIYDKTKLRMLNKKLLSAEQLQQRQATSQKRKIVDMRIWGALNALQRLGYARNVSPGSGRWQLTDRAPASMDAQDTEEQLAQLEVLGEIESEVEQEAAEGATFTRWPRHTMRATNLILYGPPGTGKTFATTDRAVRLADPAGYPALKSDRPALQARFEELVAAGRIAFVTFHQSYGYEDFVEGIRPVVRDGQVHYDVRPGIFRKMAAEAARALVRVTAHESLWEAAQRLVQSGQLPGISVQGDELVAVYAGGSTSSPARIKRAVVEGYQTSSPLSALKDAMDEGDATTRTILERFLGKALEARSTRELDQVDTARTPHFVLVIDEINRGHISRIFGELITLLEPNKRLGAPDHIPVVLPVSEESFGVPPNLHVIGTMNTADKSIALLDAALRRRFRFEELMPDPSVVPHERARAVMTRLNMRIELLRDREHQLGHALFLDADSDAAIRDVLVSDVLPLLKEYFYNQWNHIAQVLGSSQGGQTSILRRRVLAGHGLDEEALELDEAPRWEVHPDFLTKDPTPFIDAFLR